MGSVGSPFPEVSFPEIPLNGHDPCPFSDPMRTLSQVVGVSILVAGLALSYGRWGDPGDVDLPPSGHTPRSSSVAADSPPELAPVDDSPSMDSWADLDALEPWEVFDDPVTPVLRPGEINSLRGPRTADPIDPVIPGPCRLRLRLVDPAGQPLTSVVRLWRLGAPENRYWLAGDQCQREFEVPVDGVELSGLAEGTYRLVCGERDLDEADPEAFEVLQSSSGHSAVVVVPRPYTVRLHIVGAAETLSRIERTSLTTQRAVRSSWRDRPDWAELRRVRRTCGFMGLSRGSRYGPRFPALDLTWREESLNGGVVVIGPLAPSTHRKQVVHSISFRLPEGQEIDCRRLSGPGDLVAPALDVAAIRRGIVYPDGSTGEDHASQIRIIVDAMPETGRVVDARVTVVVSEGDGAQEKRWTFAAGHPIRKRALKPLD